MGIHKEGYKIIPITAAFITLLYFLMHWVFPFFIIRALTAFVCIAFFSFVVRFFRDPRIITPQKEGIVYAPCDGRVISIKKCNENEWLKGKCIQISIFMSPLNVHVNRSPVRGKVSFYRYHSGKYLVAWHPKSSTLNERTSIGFETDSGVEILMRQIAGAVARRIVFYPKVGDLVNQGSSVGFIRFGSRVDLFLPVRSEIKLKVGDLTTGGITEVAATGQPA